MPLTLQQRVSLVQCYYANNNSIIAALRSYRALHNQIHGPCTRAALRNLINKFEITGSVLDAKREGRPSVPEDEVAEVLHVAQELSEQSPHGTSSVRNVGRQLQLPTSTVWKIMRTTLKLFPYKMHRVQELKPPDLVARYNFSLHCVAESHLNDEWIRNVLFTNEAHFYLNGFVNNKNCVIWDDTNPHAILPQPLHSPKLTVWCGFTANFIIGPYFFQQEVIGRADPVTVTVTGNRYREMLMNMVIPQLQQRGVIDTIIYLQDGAPPHIQNGVRQLLQQHFGNRIISRHFPVVWPARSPDLNPLDFWLWGYLKEKVFLRRPLTLPQMQEFIINEVAAIPNQLLASVANNFLVRTDAVIMQQGNHFEQFL